MLRRYSVRLVKETELDVKNKIVLNTRVSNYSFKSFFRLKRSKLLRGFDVAGYEPPRPIEPEPEPRPTAPRPRPTPTEPKPRLTELVTIEQPRRLTKLVTIEQLYSISRSMSSKNKKRSRSNRRKIFKS